MHGPDLNRDPTNARDTRRGKTVLPGEAEQRFAAPAEMHDYVAPAAESGDSELMPAQELAGFANSVG